MAPRSILLTGFEPFGREAVNPSWLLAQAPQGETIAGDRVHALSLPCAFADALAVLGAEVEGLHPRIVLALGHAAGHSDFSLGRIRDQCRRCAHTLQFRLPAH